MRVLFIFLLISFSSFGQDTTKYFRSNDYGWNWQRGKFRANLIIPTDTTTNKLGIAQIGNTFYVYNNRWVAVGVNLGVQSPLVLSSNTISLPQATSSVNGFLSSTDWATFNNKLSSINSSMVISALGYTPYNATNPSGYITSSALSPYLLSSTAASTYLPITGGTLTSRLNATSLVLNKDSLPIVTSRIWGMVLDTVNNIVSRQLLPIAANPTNTIGLTAINGTATTFMRSDAAPAINLGIVPTWTGSHTFTAPTVFNTTSTANNNQIAGFTFSGSSICAINNLGFRSNTYTNFGGTLSIMSNAYASTQFGNQIFIGSYGTFNQTTGANMLTVNGSFTTQTNAVNNIINIAPTFDLNANTTNAAIQRGLFYNPTITNLRTSQHRAIETVSGDIVLGSTSGNLSFGAVGSFGGGSKVVFIANATTVPTTNPTGGGILFVEGGALKYRGSSGTVTTIANP